jgi:membrane protein DedA with SNARE-associated domain
MIASLEKAGIVFLLGIAGIWKAIPVGFILKLDPFLIFISTSIGALVGVLIIYFLGTKVKSYMVRRMNRKERLKKKSKKVHNLIDRYGTAGTGLIGPLVFGPNMTMALGLVLIRAEKKLLVWTLVGTVTWSVVLTIVASFSIELFQRLKII